MLNFIPLSLSLVCSTDNNDCQKIVLDSLEKVVWGRYLEAILGGCQMVRCGNTHKPISASNLLLPCVAANFLSVCCAEKDFSHFCAQ